ncbi:MAG: hypothetical protein K2N17_04070, partial [Clostridia bacterium]|nr:hypothetical protein [Clostridia bacterium]
MCGTVFSFSKTDNKVTASAEETAAPASIVNLSGAFKKSLKGAQKENIYFGTNDGSMVKWRVLDTGNKNKYSSGNMLLFADSSLITDNYNVYSNNPDYAFWGTSYIRAWLNGGTYYKSIGSPTGTPSATAVVSDSESVYSMFTVNEKRSIVAAGSYTTDHVGIDTTIPKSELKYARKGIVVTESKTTTTSAIYGKYNTTRLDETPTAQYATYNTEDGTVTETTSGDMLFLLDYYDINTADYGFCDASGVTYANKVNPSWDPSFDYYPTCYDGTIQVNALNNTINGITLDCLKSDDKDGWWIRTASRCENRSQAMFVTNDGFVWDTNISGYPNGWRPAFNLNANSVVYATAAPVTSIGSTFAKVDTPATTADGKPAYKLYTKASDYVDYSGNSSAVKLDIKSNSVTVTKTGQTGQAVILLSDRNKAGEVKYQATTTFAGGQATVNVPSGIKAGEYVITVLFLDTLNGDVKSECVKASFTQSGIVPPKDYTETYSGECLWNNELENDCYSVKSIKYTSPAKDATEQTLTATEGGKLTDLIVDAGTYKVTFELAEDQLWTDGTTADKTITITVNQKVIDPFLPTVEYGKNEDNSTKQYFEGTETSGFPEIKPPAAWNGKGTLVWDDKQTLKTNQSKYNWTFTPDSLNFAEKKGDLGITVTKIGVGSISAELTGTGDIFTSTKLDDLLKRITVTKTNNDGSAAGVAATSEIQFAPGTTLTDGQNKELTVQLKSDPSITCKITIPEILAVVPAELTVEHDGSTVYTSTSADDLKAQLTVKVKNNDGSAGKTLDSSEYSFPADFELTDGDFKLEVSYKYGTGENDILKGSTTVSVAIAGVKQVKIKTVSVPVDATLWENAAANTIKQYLTVEVTFDDGNDTTATLEASKYTVNILGSAKNVLVAGQCNFTVSYGGKTSSPKSVTVTPLLVETLAATYTQTGTIYSSATVEDLQIDTLLSVDATFNNGDEETLDSDSYTVVIPKGFSSTNNVVEVVWKKGEVEKKTTFTVNVTDVDVSGMMAAYTAPDGKTIDAENVLDVLKEGLEVELSYNNGDKKILKATEYVLEADAGGLHGDGKLSAGTRTITVKFTDNNSNEWTDTFEVEIEKADFDTSGIEFAGDTVTCDGEKHELKISGVELPDWITVTYEYDGDLIAAGTYEITAKFTHDNPNYNTIKDKTAKLIIDDAVIIEIKAELSEKEYSTANTLDDLKAKLTVTAIYNNGTTEEVEDCELDFSGLGDNGNLKYGTQSLTVKYGEFTTVVNNIIVTRQKVELPTFKGGLSYTGVAIKPTVDNFNGYDSALMTFVADKTLSGLTVGSYKAVFALNDYENYEWATVTTYKKSVFAAVVYDEEITLNANEAAVDWNISKAVLTATKTEGGLPVFASDSFIGAFADVVTLKYYKDETCTEEVAAEELKYETQYYVKAELLDTDNFELDASAAQYTVKSFGYTTPAKELTGFEKILAIVKKNWLWIVIAVAALILLILIIALAARSAKKKREREEQRRLEEKEEKKREQEERERREEERRQREDERRREEREERMAARMAQPQMMPQMPPMMGGQMPQSMPAAQPTVAGVASSNEIAELKAEMAAMKATQDMAKEIAELRMEVMRAEQNAVMRSDVNALRFGGEQTMAGGVTLQALTELIRTEVRNAMADEKAAAQSATAEGSAAPVTAQVPPDAVMTTVTTTKID